MQSNRSQLLRFTLAEIAAYVTALAVYAGWVSCAVAAGNISVVNSNDQLSDLAALVSKATVRIETTSDRFSGVLVSNDGFIFTVAHGLRSSDIAAAIVWHDGSVAKAGVVLRDTDQDIAVLQVQQDFRQAMPKPLFFAKGASARVVMNSMMLAAGCPGREDNGAGAVVRIGNVVAASRSSIRTTCALTVGDSGGPLVNQHGQVVGLNSRIGLAASANLHLPLGLIRSLCTQTASLKSLFDGENVAVSSVKISSRAAAEATDALRQMTVSIYSGNEALCLGTIVNSNTVVSKLSELQYREELSCLLADKKRIPLTLKNADQSLDLVVLKTSGSDIELPDHPVGNSSDSSVAVGSPVYASSTGAVAIVGRKDYSEPREAAKLGCVLTAADATSLQVDEVSPDSAAMDAGLTTGDRLISVNDTATGSFHDLEKLLHHFQPGDVVKFVVWRSGQNMESVGRLRSSPENLLERTEFVDGRAGELSRRRTGFVNVIQHDSALSPRQMGGPLVNAAGRLIAINIARRSRESVLAVPVAEVLKLVDAVTEKP